VVFPFQIISIDGFSMFFLNSHETRWAVPCHSPTLTDFSPSEVWSTAKYPRHTLEVPFARIKRVEKEENSGIQTRYTLWLCQNSY
jgi:hypothetical protein